MRKLEGGNRVLEVEDDTVFPTNPPDKLQSIEMGVLGEEEEEERRGAAHHWQHCL
jgi:hypothetical protein